MGKRFATRFAAFVLLCAQIFALVPGMGVSAYAQTEETSASVQEEAAPAEQTQSEIVDTVEPEVETGEVEVEGNQELEEASTFASASAVTPVPYAYSNAAYQSEGLELSGLSYSDAVLFTMGYTGLSNGYTGEVTYNFKGLYSSLTFKAGYYDGHERNAAMTVIADGVTVYDAVEISYEDIARSYTVSLAGVDQLVIRFHSNAYDKTKYAIASVKAVPASSIQEETAVSDEFYDIPQYLLQNTDVITGAFTMGGNSYENGYKMRMGYTGASSGYTGKVCFNFNNQYEKLTFDIAKFMNRTNEQYTRSAYLTIEVDGTVLAGYDAREMKWNDLVHKVEINLNGVSQVVISVHSDGYDKVYWAMGDIQLVSDGKAHGVLLAASKATLTTSAPTFDLNPRVYPSDADNKDIELGSNSNITAFVDSDGIVHGRHSGTAVITVTTVDGGHSATCTITSKLSAAKYIPSEDGWGFHNYNISNSEFFSNYNYYVSTYERITAWTPNKWSESAANDIFGLENINNSIQYSASLVPSAGDAVWANFWSLFARGGQCHGMSISSAMTYTNAIPFSYWDWGSSEYENPYAVKSISTDVGYSDALDLYLKQLIFACHMTQVTPGYLASNWLTENKYEDLFAAVRNFQNTGRDPIVLTLNKSGSSHTVLPYEVYEYGDYVMVFIYDPNITIYDDPNFAYITFVRDESGEIANWAFIYDFERDDGTREYDVYQKSDTDLTYVESLELSTYANKIKAYEDFNIIDKILFTTSNSFSVKNNGNSLLSFSNGSFSGDRNQAIAVPLVMAGADGESEVLEGAMVAVLEDADLSVELGGGEAEATTVYYTENSACVITSDGSADVSVQPGEQTDVITVKPSRDGNVTIRYNNGDKSVIVSGEASDSVVIKTDDAENEVSFKGYSDMQATIIIDGEETSGEKITVSPDGTYTVTDDAEVERDAASAFEDVVEGAYYSEPIAWAVKNGITTGLSSTEFGVDVNCTRAQFVTFLWRAAGCPEPTSSVNQFADVEKDQFYSKAVLWAVENGITTGLAADKFGVNDPCTRAQVVTFLHRFAGKPEPTITDNPFKDAENDQFYSTAILWAVENGITTGLDATTFGVNLPCNRAQVVTFLFRALT